MRIVISRKSPARKWNSVRRARFAAQRTFSTLSAQGCRTAMRRISVIKVSCATCLKADVSDDRTGGGCAIIGHCLVVPRNGSNQPFQDIAQADLPPTGRSGVGATLFRTPFSVCPHMGGDRKWWISQCRRDLAYRTRYIAGNGHPFQDTNGWHVVAYRVVLKRPIVPKNTSGRCPAHPALQLRHQCLPEQVVQQSRAVADRKPNTRVV